MAWVPIRTIYEGKGSHISPIDHVVRFFRVVRKAWNAARSA